MADVHVRRACPALAVVVPCYNEEQALACMLPRFVALLDGRAAEGRIAGASRVVLVDDGSSDGTWARIARAARERPDRVVGIRLDANVGQQRALLAGLTEVRGRCDACVTLDCDGQDDLSAVPRMLDAYASGADVVCGVRRRRDGDGVLKRASARLFYRLMNVYRARLVFDHADFRLMDASVLDALARFDDGHEVLLRAVVPSLRFQMACVEYDRGARVAGETHYSFARMVALAATGVRTAIRVRHAADKPVRSCGASAFRIAERVGTWDASDV